MALSWFRPARSYSGRPWLDSQRRMHQPCKSDNSDEPWVPEGQSGRNFGGAFLKSGRTRGPGKALQNVGARSGPPGPARPQKCTQTNPARLASSTQVPWPAILIKFPPTICHRCPPLSSPLKHSNRRGVLQNVSRALHNEIRTNNHSTELTVKMKTKLNYPRGLAGPEIVEFGDLNGPLLHKEETL